MREYPGNLKNAKVLYKNVLLLFALENKRIYSAIEFCYWKFIFLITIEILAKSYFYKIKYASFHVTARKCTAKNSILAQD